MPKPSPDRRIDTFEEFWPFYLREHAKPRTRALHYFGTGLASACLLFFVVAGNPWILLGAPVAGYGPAWFAHFFVEKNKPATFTYPLWSLAGDFRMTFSWLTGHIAEDLVRAGVHAPVR
ncbi:MAG: DUF962 domain-containing protein [Alphaproteobacteria bacterium]|nr:DUF962 domain-containing protein [Alphaproteobacteria bacterium]MDE2110437.1 DUF962 domain-containing protein [Alphaproteobacteria bacterium]MDE2493404.1 DUF962 domain-containing protein [Alphaproteobacteria bacterium]